MPGRQARESPEVADRVEADALLAADLSLRVEGPSVVVSGPGGTEVLQDSPSTEDVDAAVLAARDLRMDPRLDRPRSVGSGRIGP